MKKKSKVPMRSWKVLATKGDNSLSKTVKALDPARAVMKVLDLPNDMLAFQGGTVKVTNDRGETTVRKIDIDYVGYAREPYDETVVELPCYGIAVTLGKRNAEGVRGGTIVSDLRDDINEDSSSDDSEYLAAVDALEAMILAHTCAEVDVTSPAYLEGIEVVVAAISQQFLG